MLKSARVLSAPPVLTLILSVLVPTVIAILLYLPAIAGAQSLSQQSLSRENNRAVAQTSKQTHNPAVKNALVKTGSAYQQASTAVASNVRSNVGSNVGSNKSTAAVQTSARQDPSNTQQINLQTVSTSETCIFQRNSYTYSCN